LGISEWLIGFITLLFELARWYFALKCFVPQQKYFSLTEMFCPAHCRGGYYFLLDKKAAKNQDRKNLLPAGPAPGPIFCRAIAHFLLTLHQYYLS
jgi:hypothetical protein